MKGCFPKQSTPSSRSNCVVLQKAELDLSMKLPSLTAKLHDTLHDYFDALYRCDMVLLGAVFHPGAIYVCATEEPLVQLTMEEYFPIVEARDPPSTRGELRRDTIETISFAGPRTAFARVRCAIGHRYFTDFLTLIEQDGRWQIISKVFHFELLPDEPQ